MPTFTMELWRVLDLKPDGKTEDEWLGLSEYPLFNGIDRAALNKKIKDHFMYQEIGHETVEQFTFSLKRKMNEIMPAYNLLYKTAQMDFDPLATIDMRTLATGTSEQVTEGSSQNETESDIDSKAKNVASNFPGMMLGGNKDYATNGADSNSQTNTKADVTETTSAKNDTTQENESRTTGYQGVPAQLIQAYRAAIINVDMLIIAELDVLFMMVWNNGDDYTQTKGRLY